MKRELIEDWHQAWKWASVNCMALAAAIQGAWLYVPDDMKSSIPPKLVSGVTIALLALGVFGRLTRKVESPKQEASS